MPELGEDANDDFLFIEREEPGAIPATLLELVKTRIPNKLRPVPIQHIQVLCPMNRGSLGARELNVRFQETLNPRRTDEPVVEKFGWQFRLRDKFILTENDYDKEVFNGDIGQVTKIDPEDRELIITFDSRRVVYDFNGLDEVSLAYAITIHKSQGSEFPAVVVPPAMQQFMLLQRNLIYTGRNRGKKDRDPDRTEKGVGAGGGQRPRGGTILGHLREAGAVTRRRTRICRQLATLAGLNGLSRFSIRCHSRLSLSIGLFDGRGESSGTGRLNLWTFLSAG